MHTALSELLLGRHICATQSFASGLTITDVGGFDRDVPSIQIVRAAATVAPGRSAPPTQSQSPMGTLFPAGRLSLRMMPFLWHWNENSRGKLQLRLTNTTVEFLHSACSLVCMHAAVVVVYLLKSLRS